MIEIAVSESVIAVLGSPIFRAVSARFVKRTMVMGWVEGRCEIDVEYAWCAEG